MFKWFTAIPALKDQVNHLHQLLIDDRQWLLHDPVAKALTTRYLKALSNQWGSEVFEHSQTLREQLNRDLTDKNTALSVINERIGELKQELEDITASFTNQQLTLTGIKVDYESRITELEQLKYRMERCYKK